MGRNKLPSELLSQEHCADLVREVRWAGGLACAHCGSRAVSTVAQRYRDVWRRYCCRACGRWFYDLTKTPISGSHLPVETWCDCIALLARGPGTQALADALGISKTTALRMSRSLEGSGFGRRLRDRLRQECPSAFARRGRRKPKSRGGREGRVFDWYLERIRW